MERGAAPNRLTEPMPIEGRILVRPFIVGSYVTFVRQKTDAGTNLAVTSAAPLCGLSDGSTIVLFDQSFRILSAFSDENPYGDVGLPDLSGDVGMPDTTSD